MSRCAFCSNALLGFGEVEEKGKMYHAKCALSTRGVDPEAVAAAEARKKEEQQKIEEMKKKIPATLGSIESGDRKGFVIDPQTGEKRYTKK